MFKNNLKNIFKSMMWNNPYPLISEAWFGGLALSHVYRLTLVGRAKSTYVRYNYKQPTTDLEEKNSYCNPVWIFW